MRYSPNPCDQDLRRKFKFNDGAENAWKLCKSSPFKLTVSSYLIGSVFVISSLIDNELRSIGVDRPLYICLAICLSILIFCCGCGCSLFAVRWMTTGETRVSDTFGFFFSSKEHLKLFAVQILKSLLWSLGAFVTFGILSAALIIIPHLAGIEASELTQLVDINNDSSLAQWIMLGLLLLGFIFCLFMSTFLSGRLIAAPLYILNEGVGLFEAIKKSWHMTQWTSGSQVLLVKFGYPCCLMLIAVVLSFASSINPDLEIFCAAIFTLILALFLPFAFASYGISVASIAGYGVTRVEKPRTENILLVRIKTIWSLAIFRWVTYQLLLVFSALSIGIESNFFWKFLLFLLPAAWVWRRPFIPYLHRFISWLNEVADKNS